MTEFNQGYLEYCIHVGSWWGADSIRSIVFSRLRILNLIPQVHEFLPLWLLFRILIDLAVNLRTTRTVIALTCRPCVLSRQRSIRVNK